MQMSAGMELRPYQKEAVEAIFQEWEKGNKKTLLVQATGTGKTICFSAVAADVAGSGSDVLVLAHRDELLKQASDKIERSTGIECDLYEKGRLLGSGKSPITVVSVQTLSQEKRLSAADPGRYGAIIIDEAHHSVSPTYRRIIGHFPDAYLLGVTATADRADKKSLATVFDSIAYEYTLAKAIEEGYLCPIKALMVPLEVDISGVRIEAGDYSAGGLASAIEPYFDAIAEKMLEVCRGRHTLVFLPLVELAKRFCSLLNQKGLSACEVDGKSDDRSAVLHDFAEGRYEVCCNSMLLTEGWDCPSVDCIVNLRPTKSTALYKQIIGRGTRLSPETGKAELLVLDFLWQTGQHNLCRPASLLAEDDIQQKLMEKKIQEAGEPVDLLEGRDEAIEAIRASREEEAIASIAESIERNRNRRSMLVDPVQLGNLLGDMDIIDHEDVFAWQRKAATQKQLSYLGKLGIDGEGVSKGMAAALIDAIARRWNAGLATPKQMRLLASFGFHDVGRWTKDGATTMIDAIARNRWRIPAGIDPKSFMPL